MSVAGRWWISPHAVRRYVERIEPGLTYNVALARLIKESEMAHRVKEIAPGVGLWRGGRPLRLRFRVSTRGPGLPQLMTVMAGKDVEWRGG